MANKKREVQFKLNDDDYKAFGHYRILYTDQGRKMVNRQKLTMVIIGVGVALLFTIFKVDRSFQLLMYALSALCAVGGFFFAESMVLRQQDRVIEDSQGDIERVRAENNRIFFGDEEFVTYTGEDEQHFKYSDIKLIDLTEAAIYVWMSDTMIMPVPLHAFKSMEDMKALYKWIKERTEAEGENVAE